MNDTKSPGGDADPLLTDDAPFIDGYGASGQVILRAVDDLRRVWDARVPLQETAVRSRQGSNS